MGYKSKREIMEAIKNTTLFNSSEIDILNRVITDNSDKEAILDSHALNEIERNGLRDRFLKFCKNECVFPQWVDNANKGVD